MDRRSFLGRLGLAAAGAAVLPSVASCADGGFADCPALDNVK
ncbi:MAG: twin-arginine translocation signal domain-containing protein, partial [Bacteroidales bacterium]|nr:twin-arginine translocation signal domain-containing protein [Bacteroidales bacterium]